MRRYLAAMFVVIAASTSIGCKNQPAKSEAPAPAAQSAGTPAAAPAAEQNADADTVDQSKFNDYGEPIRSGADFPVTMPFARDTRTFKIGPLDGVEFNFRMEKGGTMVYSWKASEPLAWDFHGEPKGSKPGYAEGYATGQSKEGNGGFMAPFPGIHGFFWQNPGEKTVTLTLTTAGHYTEGLLTMPDDTKASKPLNPR